MVLWVKTQTNKVGMNALLPVILLQSRSEAAERSTLYALLPSHRENVAAAKRLVTDATGARDGSRVRWLLPVGAAGVVGGVVVGVTSWVCWPTTQQP